jgi:hypothetical protein
MRQLLSEKLRKRVFTDKQFKEASRIDKIYMSFISPKYCVLCPRDEEYKEVLWKAYAIVCEHRLQAIVFRVLKERFPTYNNGSLTKIISDVQYLFGNVFERNVKFDRLIQREQILKHIEALLKPKKSFTDSGREYEILPTEKEYAVVASLEKLIMSLDDKIAAAGPTDEKSIELPKILLSTDSTLLLETNNYGEEE